MVNGTNYTPCPDLWQISFSCEMSNLASMFVELIIALSIGGIFAIVLALWFYQKGKKEDIKAKRSDLRQKLAEIYYKSRSIDSNFFDFSHVERAQIVYEIHTKYSSLHFVLHEFLPGKQVNEIRDVIIQLVYRFEGRSKYDDTIAQKEIRKLTSDLSTLTAIFNPVINKKIKKKIKKNANKKTNK